MCLSASISCAHRLSMIFTGPCPKMSRSKMSDRLACGSTEKTRTLWPCCASQNAAAAENVVLPSPPFPPNITYRRFGCSRNTAASEPAPSVCGSAPPDVSPCVSIALPSSEHRVGQVLLAQHPALPRRDLRYDVGQQAQRVVRRQDRHTDEIAHRHQDEQVLHAASRAQRRPRHVVRGHPVGDLADLAKEPFDASGVLRCHPARLFFSHRSLRQTPCRSNRWSSVNWRSRNTRRRHVCVCGTTYGSSRSEY